VRDVSLGRVVALEDLELLVALEFAQPSDNGFALTAKGAAFEDAWIVYRNKDAARELLRTSLVDLPPTQALIQGLHGRGSVPVDGALHLLARLQHADPDNAAVFRVFLKMLNDFGIVAYSNKLQTVRVTTEMPQLGAEADVPVRIVQPERAFSNVRNLREVLRACTDYIWWADPHFAKKGFESLTDEADATKISNILILSGPAQAADAVKDYKRFQSEMQGLGITVEWRIVQTADRDWHDRFIVTKDKAWNVPPLNTIYKGDYSEFARTQRPPYVEWWKKGTPLS
jgi:hypothetical protein